MAQMNLGHVQNGYPGLAKLMGQNLDQGLGIFKQFAGLSTRSLLYMQAELLCLEQELDVLTHVDEHGPDLSKKNFARSVWEMRRPSKPCERPQWEKVLEIRERLKDYSSIAKLDRPDKNDLKWLRVWLQHKDGGKSFLEGCEYRAYDEMEQPDLISVSSRPSNDKFTRWLEMSLVPRLPGFLRNLLLEPMIGSEKTDIWRIKLGILNRFARALTVVLSAIIPFIAIVVLYMIGNLRHRIAAIAVFSGAFAFVLAIFTTARPVEIFAATAAFTSVQVVFVGGTAGEGGQCQCVS